MKEKILILGEWKAGLDVVKDLSTLEGYVSVVKPTSDAGLAVKTSVYDLVILCVPKEALTSEEAIGEIRFVNDAIPILVVSDHEGWEPAAAAMKSGANDYLNIKSLKDRFKRVTAGLLKTYLITRKVYFMEDSTTSLSPFEGMLGVSERMQENFRMIQAVSKSNATVLIMGESGTGKELVAKAIHRQSNRVAFKFVDLNCGAIPRELLENELFGHEKGSFTGAHRRYQGSFETAHRGTLFLDEISEMDALLQVKLLRVLQERNFMRIGGNEKIEVDVRIIAATNRNLQESIEQGQFREDLFYRLNVVSITIPPLRERREDVPLLAAHFLEYYSAKNNRIFIDFSEDALEALINYDWPGNVRELENIIERVVVLHNDSEVKLKYLPKQLQKVTRAISYKDMTPQVSVAEEGKIIPLDDLERNAIEMALMKYQGNIAVAAKKLKIGQATLYRKVKKYGLGELGKTTRPLIS